MPKMMKKLDTAAVACSQKALKISAKARYAIRFVPGGGIIVGGRQS